ncbi:hypothetical protein [Flavobacterium johnsoniae]|uniref:hypothetical protein n=1 Tax=Flavobacterium johnsoniae TaxID=986 RepID=UPI00165A0D20|nr:hypothetical protein [Flavobacterium johnsoniae]
MNNNELKKILDKLNSSEKSNIGDKITAGRIVPRPSNTLKPTIIIKPKEEK